MRPKVADSENMGPFLPPAFFCVVYFYKALFEEAVLFHKWPLICISDDYKAGVPAGLMDCLLPLQRNLPALSLNNGGQTTSYCS